MGAMQSTRQAEEKVLFMPLVDKPYDQALQFNQLFATLSCFPWATRNPHPHNHLLAVHLSALRVSKRNTHTHVFGCCLIPKWKNNHRNQVAVFTFYATYLGSRCKRIHMFMLIGVHGQVKPVSHLIAYFHVSNCLSCFLKRL